MAHENKPVMSKPRDVTRHTMDGTLKGGTYFEQAGSLLDRYPKADRAKLLQKLVAAALMSVRFGNKREERSACEFLNYLQETAADMEVSP